MNSVKVLFDKIIRLRLIQHTIFWAVSYVVLLELFTSSSEPAKIDFIYTVVFIVTLIIPVYLNLYVCIPVLLSKRKYFLYGVVFFSLILFFSGFNLLIFNKLIDYVLKDYYFISYFLFWDITWFFIVFLLITSLIKLSKAWFVLTEARQKLMESERQKVENELLALIEGNLVKKGSALLPVGATYREEFLKTLKQ